MKTLKSINPANQEVVGELPVSSMIDVKKKVVKAREVFKSWRKTSVKDRAKYLKKLTKLLKKNKEEISVLVTKEMGKPISQSRDDVDWEINYIDWYATEGARALEREAVGIKNKIHYEVTYEPWGVVGAIAPWNFPLSMASSGISASILAGNAVVFKPSEYSSLSQKMFVDLLNQTGLPRGVLDVVIGDGSVGKMLTDQDIDFVWFTGSTPVGQEIYKKAADKFIKVSLELGGSDPAIILKDVNPEKIVESIYWGRFFNCGQVCSAIKRLFVHKSLFNDVVLGLVKKLETVKVGDPFESGVEIGPLVSKTQLRKLVKQVDESVKMGARVDVGGARPKNVKLNIGNYYLPTIMTNMSFEMPVMKEEVFGPVLPIIPFTTEKEAIEMANKTQWGLSSYVFTNDLKKGREIALQIKSGSVGINTDALYQPFCPIGGAKMSGIGKEYGIHGVREFAQMKLLAVRK